MQLHVIAYNLVLFATYVNLIRVATHSEFASIFSVLYNERRVCLLFASSKIHKLCVLLYFGPRHFLEFW